METAASPFRGVLARVWWLVLLRGLAGVLFGILAFAWPGVTLITLALFYGAYAMADGIFSLISAFNGDAQGQRWWLVFVGLAGILAGVVTFMWPKLTALVLLFCIAFWAIATGVLQILGGIGLRGHIQGGWLLTASGVVSLLFGVLVLVHPGAGALALIWVIGAYAVAHGILLIGFALRLRGWATL